MNPPRGRIVGTRSPLAFLSLAPLVIFKVSAVHIAAPLHKREHGLSLCRGPA
jgi:hypothetical protein